MSRSPTTNCAKWKRPCISRHGLASEHDDGETDDEGEHDDGRVRYERVRGVPEPGSFRPPHHAVHALGAGDGRTAGRVIASLFGTSADDPLTIPPETVRALGHGDVKAGARVLKKFVAMLGGRGQSRIIEQPDGQHARG
jgi:hypothetical protein